MVYLVNLYVRRLIAQLGLIVTQRIVYKMATKRKHSDAVADNLLNQNFNLVATNEVWAGNYLKKRHLVLLQKNAPEKEAHQIMGM